MPERRHVDEVARRLLAPLLARPYSERSGWRLVDWDVEQGVSVYLEGPGRTLLIELVERDDSRPRYGRTRHFNLVVRRHLDTATSLDDMDRAIVDRILGMVRHRERDLVLPDRPSTGRRALVREIVVDRILIAEGQGQYYVNPYVGCTIGCAFCFAAGQADFSRRLEGLPSMGWGRWVDVKVNAVDVLSRELEIHPPGPVRFSPVVTDPYQPLEKRHRITRRCLEAMVGTGFMPVILTRAARVVEDIDLLTQLPGAAVGLTIPTDDDGVRHRFEPGADPIEERLEALAALRSAGLNTFAVIQPMLPMDPEALVARLAPLVRSVRVDRMHDLPRVVPLYEQAGMPTACNGDFFDRIRRSLEAGFAARSIPVDALDDLWRVVARENGS